jgi:hypothetical protein
MGRGGDSTILRTKPKSPLIEAVPTAFFLIVIMGATSRRAPAGLAPILGVVVGGTIARWLQEEGTI